MIPNENTIVKNDEMLKKYGRNLKILRPNDQIKELQTILRDKWVVTSIYLRVNVLITFGYAILLMTYPKKSVY